MLGSALALILAALPTGGPVAGVAEARSGRDRALEWLVSSQAEDGSWGRGVLDSQIEYGFSVETFYAWKVAADALACLALGRAEETPERRAALEGGVRWLCETRTPRRGNDWDIDYVWAGLYGLVACAELAADPRFATETWAASIDDAGRRFAAILVATQEPTGGWGYYDDPIYSRRPKWGTSFSTALVLPALADALGRGWIADEAVLERARRYVRRCALPNGAYAYDLRPVPRVGGESIDHVKGSLGRIQVCNWGLSRVGDERITPGRVREGLTAFLREHRFLDAAFLKPVPHEAYYYNSGYFYLFGHFYAAEAIALLPAAEREGWHRRLRPHLLRIQRADGSAVDFPSNSTMVVAGTAYLALALDGGLREDA